MGGNLTYRHEDGMNFASVLDDIIVGSCLQTPQDVDRCNPLSSAAIGQQASHAWPACFLQ